MSPDRLPPSRQSQAITYFVPREGRRRWPVAASGVVLLGALVTGQVALVTSAPPSPVVAGPAPTDTGTLQPSAAPGPEPTQAPTTDPATDPVPTPEPTLEPVAPPATAAPDPGLREVDEVRITFAAGAVLDEQARQAVAGLAEVLAAADAAPVVVLGSAEPGGDEEAARRLAASRARAVTDALVDLGVPEQLLRVVAVVDADAGRTVVVAPDRP